MNKMKLISCILAAALITASFAACGNSSAQEKEDTTLKNEQKQGQNQRGTMAKVVSLDGDTITVILADMPDRKGGEKTSEGAAPPDGAMPGGEDETKAGSKPGEGTPPDRGNAPASGTAIDGNGPGGGRGDQSVQGGGQIEFTGEEVTYTLSDDVSVIKGTGDDAAEIDLSEIEADSLVSFTTETDADGNETIISIRVME